MPGAPSSFLFWHECCWHESLDFEKRIQVKALHQPAAPDVVRLSTCGETESVASCCKEFLGSQKQELELFGPYSDLFSCCFLSTHPFHLSPPQCHDGYQNPRCLHMFPAPQRLQPHFEATRSLMSSEGTSTPFAADRMDSNNLYGLHLSYDGPQPTSDSLHPVLCLASYYSAGLQPSSDGLQPTSDGL